MAKALLKMASDENVSESVRLSAIKDALDRSGLGARTAVDVEVSVAPWEAVMEEVAGSVVSGSREDFRRQRDGVPPIPPALANRPAADDRIVDAEIVTPVEEFVSRLVGRDVNDTDGPMPYDDAEDAPSTRLAGNAAPSGGLLPMDEAVAIAAEMRRNAPPMPPPLGLRALPRGRG
jgi:hypothetical protein